MANNPQGEKIDRNSVVSLFDNNAVRLRNNNSVLDAGSSTLTQHTNIYRDYFCKYYPEKAVAPKSTDTLLDFGCGVGRLSTYFAPKVKWIDGVDASAEMIKVAQKNNQFTNVHYDHITGNTLPFIDSYFDIIISCWVLQHISNEDLIEFFTEFKRVLKPGGRLVLFEQTKNHAITLQHVHVFRTVEQYCELAANRGFTVLKAQRVVKVPSRGMSIWNKLHINSHLLLVLLQILDRLLLNRKPEFAQYYSSIFIFRK